MASNGKSDSTDIELSFSDAEIKVLKYIGVSETEVRDTVRILQDWIRQQPHLPECAACDLRVHELRVSSQANISASFKIRGPETKMLCRIWASRKMSLERTKQTVDMYYSVRNLIPEFFKNRDPVILQEQQIFKHFRGPRTNGRYKVPKHVTIDKPTGDQDSTEQFIPMPNMLDDFTQVIIDIYAGTEDHHYDLNQRMKTGIMICELMMRNSRALGFHFVFDLKNYSLGFIKKLTPAFLKKLQVKAYPVRIKSIHFVNSPAYVDKLVTLFKMVLIPKLSKRIIVHTSGLGSLHDHIHPKYLPLEYGGELGPVQDIWGEYYVSLCGIICGRRTLSSTVNGSWNKRTSAAMKRKDLGNLWTRVNCLGWKDPSRNSLLIEYPEDMREGHEEKRPGKPLDQSELFGMEGSFKKLSVD
uniref:CRAL-TRIO domain-containing protein n=1 Tax=Timema tahoe TaxID=61484 RepID=A0A7R9IFJ1_9NEOP|nr:unnamed protein product [Timema tahoe]